MRNGNINEKSLLNWLIDSGKLGKGVAKFEVNVGVIEPKFIDLVFESDELIWIVEAKKRMNCEAFGQVLVYRELYKQKGNVSKPIKLAIVCVETDLDIEWVCKKYDINIFIYKQESKRGEGIIICEVCGSEMVKIDEDKFECKICKYFFGTSGMIEKCEKCGSLYGTYPKVVMLFLEVVYPTKHQTKKYWIEGICPECRRKIVYMKVGTVAEHIRKKFERREVIMSEFEALPREFLEYCLGRFRPKLD